MKRLNVSIQCITTYDSFIDVPDEMEVDDAIQYANDHINEIPIGELERLSDSDCVYQSWRVVRSGISL